MTTFTQRVLDLATATGVKLKELHTKVGALTSLTTANKTSVVVAINEVMEGLTALQNATSINDTSSNSSTQTWSISKIVVELAAQRDAILGGAGAAYDTLAELQALLQGDAAQLATILTALGKRVAVDQVQTFTTGEKLQARTNIGAQDAAAIGFNDENFVTTLNTAMQ